MKTQIKTKKLSGKALMLFVLFLLLASNLSFAQSGWFPVYTDSSGGFQYVYFINSNTGYATGVRSVNNTNYPRVMKTTNAGANWFEQLTPFRDSADLNYRCVSFADINTGILVFAQMVSPATYGGLVRTTNGGINWNKISIPVDAHMTRVKFINSSTGFATGYHIIYKTTNAGLNWVPAFQSSSCAYLFGIFFNNDNTGYVVGNNGFILKTSNCGENWIQQTSNYYTSIWDVWFTDINTGFVVGGHSSNVGNKILKTTNNGSNWDSVIHPISNGFLFSITFTSQNTGYVTGDLGQILKTTNGGFNWYNQYFPFSGPDSNQFFARNVFFTSNDTGYAAGIMNNNWACHIFKTVTAGEPTGIKPISIEVPAEFKLEQNYPNPFNPVTSIKFKVASVGQSSQTVSLRVFDLLGKEVATLVNEKLQPGTYEVTFDAGNLPSGVYFYQLKSENYTETKKLILLK